MHRNTRCCVIPLSPSPPHFLPSAFSIVFINAANITYVVGDVNEDGPNLQHEQLLQPGEHPGERPDGRDGGDAPTCLALIVTETGGTTCVVDLSSTKIGLYWIMDSQNSTPSSLSPQQASRRATLGVDVSGKTETCERTPTPASNVLTPTALLPPGMR